MPSKLKRLRVKLVRSPIGCPKDQKETVRAMGLNRLGKVVTLPNNPSVRGMIRKVQHLVTVEEETTETVKRGD